MGISNTFRISGSGLTAERFRMDAISNNLANANSTRTAEGGPYKRQVALLAAGESNNPRSTGSGVRVVGVLRDPRPPKLVHDPSHPDANAQGYVAYPNVDVVREMVDLITATRAYEANITAFNSAKSMANKALEIGR